MERNELETLIRFAKSNGIMNWPFEDVVNEYKTVKIHHEEPRFDPKTLQPYDRVLVRDATSKCWKIDFYGNNPNPYVGLIDCASGSKPYCIPYNDETEHLVGTNDDCPECYKWWERKHGTI